MAGIFEREGLTARGFTVPKRTDDRNGTGLSAIKDRNQ